MPLPFGSAGSAVLALPTVCQDKRQIDAGKRGKHHGRQLW